MPLTGLAWQGNRRHHDAAHRDDERCHNHNGDKHSASPFAKRCSALGGCADHEPRSAHPGDLTWGKEATTVAQKGLGDVDTVSVAIQESHYY